MIDDNTIGDAARNPGDETPGSVARIGVRATAKKAVRKAAKKTAKKATKKVAKKATKKAAGTTGRSGDGRARKKTAEKAAKPAVAAPAASEAIVADTATAGPAASETAAREAALPEASAPDAATASEVAPSSGAAIPEIAADGSPPAAKRAPPADAARWIGPAHPGAHMAGAESEDAGGLGSFLALWGPLVIIGFLVLVFWGGDEREMAAAHGPDASPAPASAPGSPSASAMTSVAAGTEAPQTSVPAPDPAGAVLARAFGEAGASPLPTASRAAAAWTDPGGAWPAPPGPYRTPGSRDLPAGERWVAHVGEWAPAAGGRGTPGYGAGGEPPPQWVRCEAPYYWCPAPSNPAW